MVLCMRMRKTAADAVPKFVVFTEPPTGDAMAPFDDPVANWRFVWFASQFDYYKIAHHGAHALTHQAVAGVSQVIGGLDISGQCLEQDQVLYTHNLGYAPRFKIAIGSVLIQNYHPVQIVGSTQVRTVAFYTTTTELHCINFGTSDASTLAAATVTYDVLLFRPQGDGYDPTLPVFSAKRGILAQGMVRKTDVMLRRSDDLDTSPFDLNLAPSADIDRGCIQWLNPDGTTTTIGPYGGSATAPASIQCALTE
jgi:hypothetical protein